MDLRQALEILSYVVTILGFPTAIIVFVIQERHQRQNEENGLHRMLSEEYDNFLQLMLANSDLLLFRNTLAEEGLTPEQRERRHILYTILVSLFEKAYIIVHSDSMSRDTARLWSSWEDDMREWCRREPFRRALPNLLKGEDSEFSDYILAISAEEAGA